MTPSKVLFFFCISFVLGIFLESLVKIPAIFLWGFLIWGVLLIVVSLFLKNLYHFDVTCILVSLLGFCLLCLVLGIVRFQISEFTIANDPLSKFNDKPEKIMLTGKIIAEPDVRSTSQKLKMKVGDAQNLVLVTTNRYPEYRYLDTIQITGKLKTPGIFPTSLGGRDFNYKNYLAKDGIYSVMDFPTIEIISQKHEYNILSFTYEKILLLKGKLTESINNNFSPPNAPILQGVIFGNDKNMPQDLRDQFNATGLSHVTAVSGTNIVILISVLMIFLLTLGFWRGQAFYVSVALIWLYIIMIGFPVSGIRAAMMGSVGLLAQKLGRQNTGSRVLTMTASVMLLQNPMLLFYDISFQLSFLASMGIIHIKPLIDYYLAVFPKEKLKYWLDIVSVTLAAQIITLPIIVYDFGRISLVSPITNILVVPIIPLLTILGALVSVIGVFSNMLGFIFSLPCLALLWYFVKILELFSNPWAVKIIENISWIWVVIYYFVLVMLIAFLQKLQKPKFLGY